MQHDVFNQRPKQLWYFCGHPDTGVRRPMVDCCKQEHVIVKYTGRPAPMPGHKLSTSTGPGCWVLGRPRSIICDGAGAGYVEAVSVYVPASTIYGHVESTVLSHNLDFWTLCLP